MRSESTIKRKIREYRKRCDSGFPIFQPIKKAKRIKNDHSRDMAMMATWAVAEALAWVLEERGRL